MHAVVSWCMQLLSIVILKTQSNMYYKILATVSRPLSNAAILLVFGCIEILYSFIIQFIIISRVVCKFVRTFRKTGRSKEGKCRVTRTFSTRFDWVEGKKIFRTCSKQMGIEGGGGTKKKKLNVRCTINQVFAILFGISYASGIFYIILRYFISIQK